MQLKSIKNDSLQSLEVYFNTPIGLKCFFLQPQETKVVPSSFVTKMLEKLHRRRMIKIANYN